MARLAQRVLKPAALEAIREREGRDRSMTATQMYPVYAVCIRRSKPGKILNDIPTSFAAWVFVA